MEAQCGSSLESAHGSWIYGQLEAHQGAYLYLIEIQSQSLSRGVTKSDSYSRKINSGGGSDVEVGLEMEDT